VTYARGQNTRMGGSDPTFGGFQPPNISWDRSRLPRAARGRVLAACRNRSKHFVMQAVMHHEYQKEENAWHF